MASTIGEGVVRRMVSRKRREANGPSPEDLLAHSTPRPRRSRRCGCSGHGSGVGHEGTRQTVGARGIARQRRRCLRRRQPVSLLSVKSAEDKENVRHARRTFAMPRTQHPWQPQRSEHKVHSQGLGHEVPVLRCTFELHPESRVHQRTVPPGECVTPIEPGFQTLSRRAQVVGLLLASRKPSEADYESVAPNAIRTAIRLVACVSHVDAVSDTDDCPNKVERSRGVG